MFTGRRVDFLDGGKLTLQINRHRYYDYYTGRWLTEDPLGIDPAGGEQNAFEIRREYLRGANLYEYLRSFPTAFTDPYGLCPLAVGQPWLEREYLKTYVWYNEREWWPIARNEWISWQYEALVRYEIGIIGPTPSGDWDEGTLITLYRRQWLWPSDTAFDHIDLAEIDAHNYVCRIWVKCKAKCCKKEEPVEWTPTKIVRTGFPGFRRLRPRRAFVYGYLRSNPYPTLELPGLSVHCEPSMTWEWWERDLCTNDEHRRQCGCDFCN